MSLRTTLAAVTAAAAIALTATACGGSDNPTSSPSETPVNTTAAPAALSWTDWQGARLPVSKTDGPQAATGDVATGYSHSPQGAVLAAAQATVRLALAPDTSWAQVANKLAAPGTGRDTYAVNRALVSVTGPAPAGTAPVLKGFKFSSYSPTRAAVAIAVTQNSALTSATQTVVWDGGDWKLLLPPPGQETAAHPLSSLTGYTGFGQ